MLTCAQREPRPEDLEEEEDEEDEGGGEEEEEEGEEGEEEEAEGDEEDAEEEEPQLKYHRLGNRYESILLFLFLSLLCV